MPDPQTVEVIVRGATWLGGIGLTLATALKVLQETVFKKNGKKSTPDNGMKAKVEKLDNRLILLKSDVKNKQTNQQVNATITNRLDQWQHQFCDPRCKACGKDSNKMVETLRREIENHEKSTEKILSATLVKISLLVEQQARKAFNDILAERKKIQEIET